MIIPNPKFNEIMNEFAAGRLIYRGKPVKSREKAIQVAARQIDQKYFEQLFAGWSDLLEHDKLAVLLLLDEVRTEGYFDQEDVDLREAKLTEWTCKSCVMWQNRTCVILNKIVPVNYTCRYIVPIVRPRFDSKYLPGSLEQRDDRRTIQWRGNNIEIIYEVGANIGVQKVLITRGLFRNKETLIGPNLESPKLFYIELVNEDGDYVDEYYAIGYSTRMEVMQAAQAEFPLDEIGQVKVVENG